MIRESDKMTLLFAYSFTAVRGKPSDDNVTVTATRVLPQWEASCDASVAFTLFF